MFLILLMQCVHLQCADGDAGLYHHPLKSHCFHRLQTAEEIDKLTVDEDLNDIERAVYLLR